jgi:uncharacterized protein YjbJ (UPF0337 family)
VPHANFVARFAPISSVKDALFTHFQPLQPPHWCGRIVSGISSAIPMPFDGTFDFGTTKGCFAFIELSDDVEGISKMDWNRVEGNWKQVKGKVKEQWGKLTDDDLNVIGGRRDQLEGKIQERYGIAKDQARKDIDDWYSAQHW